MVGTRIDPMKHRVATPIAVGLAIAAGCGTRSVVYRPDPVPPVTLGALRIAVAEIVVPSDAPGLTATLDIDAPAGISVIDARAAPADASPCEAGLAAGSMSVDGRREWRRPLRLSGHTRLTLDFPVPAQDRMEDGPRSTLVTIDILSNGSDRPGCVRVPLPVAANLRKRGAWSLGGRFDLDPPLLSGLSVVARLGRWFGPVRVGVELGGSLRRCIDCISPLYAGLPSALSVEVMPAFRAGPGLGLEAAYTARPFLGVTDADRYLVHGPRATLRFAMTPPRTVDRPGGPQLHYASFDLWLARWTAIGVEHWSQTLVGVGWTWDSGR